MGFRMLPEMARLRPLPPVLPLLPLLLALSPCAPAQTVSLHANGREVRITAGDAAALPADFPADVALPQPHVVAQVRRIGAATTVEADAPGDVAAVLSQLRERMQASGWTTAKMAQPPVGQAQAWEKDHRAVVAWVRPAASGVHLQLQLLPGR
jgi:hypothetical protein